VDVARTAFLPRLDLLWQGNRATRNNVFGLLLPQSVIPAVSGPVLDAGAVDDAWSSAGGVLMSWEALDFGRRGAGVDVARAESAAAEAQRAVTELEIASGAADAYLTALAAEATFAAARANVARLEAFANVVRALVRNQLRAGAEESRSDAELAAARNRMIEAERNAELSKLALAETVGMPGSRIVLASGALEQVPPRQPGSVATTPASHPRAEAAHAEVDVVRGRDRVLDRSYFPRVELQAAASSRSVSQQQIDGPGPGSGIGGSVANWAVGLSVSFPTLDIFRTQARRRVEAGRLDEVTARYERTLQALQSQEARARTVTAAAYQIAANTPLQLRAARDGDAQARARYGAGLTNVIEVAEAQRLLADAEADNAVANLAVWRALLAEAVVRGDVEPFLNQIRAAQPVPAP